MGLPSLAPSLHLASSLPSSSLPHSDSPALLSRLNVVCVCDEALISRFLLPRSPRRRSLLRDFASHRLRRCDVGRCVALLGASPSRIGGCRSVVCFVRDIGQGTLPSLLGNFPFPHPHHEAALSHSKPEWISSAALPRARCNSSRAQITRGKALSLLLLRSCHLASCPRPSFCRCL